MTFVSITRLRIRSVRFLPAFMIDTWQSMRQVKQAPGYRGGALLADRQRTYWTMTAWDDAAAMRAYFERELKDCRWISPALHKKRANPWRRLKWAISYFLVNITDYTVTRRLNFRA